MTLTALSDLNLLRGEGLVFAAGDDIAAGSGHGQA